MVIDENSSSISQMLLNNWTTATKYIILHKIEERRMEFNKTDKIVHLIQKNYHLLEATKDYCLYLNAQQ